jgi:trafficking protein particle complex subunit 11
LYNNEHSLALSQHNAHIRKFGDFSRGWGIGEDTFEFWSWIVRQLVPYVGKFLLFFYEVVIRRYRVFAELLEYGVRSTLVLPTHLPTTSAPQSQVTLLEETSRILGLNPTNALQHPGFFYFMAAGAAEKRRERFLAIDEVKKWTLVLYCNLNASQAGMANAPGYANEKRVDHLTIVLEVCPIKTTFRW